MQLPKAHPLRVFLRETLRLHWTETKRYICLGQRSTMVVTWRLLYNRCYSSPESCVRRALSGFKRRCAFQDPFAEKTSIAMRPNRSLGGGNIRTAATIGRLRRYLQRLGLATQDGFTSRQKAQPSPRRAIMVHGTWYHIIAPCNGTLVTVCSYQVQATSTKPSLPLSLIHI